MADSGEVAMGGKTGDTVEKLLDKSIQYGSAQLARLARPAIVRLLRRGNEAMGVRELFTDLERRQLAVVLAATNATANLLGRALVRDFQRKVQVRHGVIDEGRAGAGVDDVVPAGHDPVRSHGPGALREDVIDDQRTKEARDAGVLPSVFVADRRRGSPAATSGAVLREDITRTPVEPLSPEEAIRYFSQLVPGLAADLPLFALAQRRTAFTLAVSTDRQLLGTVQDLIRERLAAGKGISTAPRAIRDVLDRAGVTPKNPQYSEMVFRTNMMDSYNQGLEDERQRPDVVDTFPVWQYLGIEDGREGDDHRPNFSKYYPASAGFPDVRGPRVFNCRCVASPISKWEWARLKAQGAEIAAGFADVPVTVEG